MPGTTTPGVRLINLTPALQITHSAYKFQPTGGPNDELLFAQSLTECLTVLEATINSFVLFIDGSGAGPAAPSMGQAVMVDESNPAAGHLVVIDHVGPEAMALVRFTARTIGRMVQQRHAVESITDADMPDVDVFKALVENSAAPMFAKDLMGRYTHANAAFLKSFPVENPIGRTDEELFARELTGANADTGLDQLSRHNKLFASNTFPIHNHSGKVVGVGGVSVRSGSGLSNYESSPHPYLDEMISESTIGVVRLGLDGRIEWCNEAMGEMLGLTCESLLGVHVDDFTPDDDALSLATSRHFIADALAGKVLSKRFTKTVKHDDGRRMRVEIISRLVTDEVTGEPSYFLSLVNDITDRVKQDHGVWQAEKMEAIGQVAANLAHDINNLLGGILGYSEILMHRLDDESARKECSVITTSALRAAQVTSQLLRFARQAPRMPAVIHLHELIKATTESSAGSPSDSEGDPITFDVQLNASASDVFGDRDALQFVVDQIVTNARTAIAAQPSRVPGSIRIATDNVTSEGAESASPVALDDRNDAAAGTSQHLIRLRITDNGVGMDEVTLRRAFEPFFSTSGVDGAGVGLASVHATIVNHGGSISASSHPGGGATFTILLPVHPQPSVDSGDPASGDHMASEEVTDHATTPPTPEPTPSIMIVDDDQVMRGFVVAALDRSGFCTVDFDNGPDAIEYFSTHHDHIQLAICDMVMPEMSGHELVHELRQHDPNVAVLMATGIDKNTPDLEFGELNAPVIQKPFRMAHLIETVNSLID